MRPRLSLHWIRAWRWPSDLTFALVSFLFCFSLCVRLCALSSFSFLATPFLLCGLVRAARRRRTRLCRRRACRSTCRVFVVLGSAPTLTAYFLLLRCRGGSVPGGMATRVPLLPRQAVNAPVRIPNRSAQCGANRYSGVSLSCFLQVIEKHSQHSLAGKTRVQAKPKDVERQKSIFGTSWLAVAMCQEQRLQCFVTPAEHVRQRHSQNKCREIGGMHSNKFMQEKDGAWNKYYEPKYGELVRTAASLEVWVQKRVEISCAFCHRKTGAPEEITTGSLSVCMHVPQNAWKRKEIGHVEVFCCSSSRKGGVLKEEILNTYFCRFENCA